MKNRTQDRTVIPRRSKRLTTLANPSSQNTLVSIPRRSMVSKSVKSQKTSTPTTVPNAVDVHDVNGNDTNSESLICRLSERIYLRDFFNSCISKRQGRSLYVSGAPGTGKTAVVLHEARQCLASRKCRLAVINCMQFSSATQVYQSIFFSLGGDSKRHSKDSRDPGVLIPALEHFLQKVSLDSCVVIILDEVDQLTTKCQDVLYRIFEWPSNLSSDSMVIVIGIANSLDLPERLLPRLQAKQHQPTHLPFPPYKPDELVLIIAHHLSCGSDTATTGGSDYWIDPLAIQLCAKKVSASTGDARRALEICRRAIDLAKQEVVNNLSKMSGNDDCSLKQVVKPGLQHISQALKESQITLSSMNTSNDLPLHHKLLLASFYLLSTQNHLRETLFSRLLDAYCTVCRGRHLPPLDESEVAGMCELLEARGMMSFFAGSGANGSTATNSGIPKRSTIQRGTPARVRRVRLLLDERALRDILTSDDATDMFSAILSFRLPV